MTEPGPSDVPVPSRIVLTGFMGTGKSTTGRILARRLGFDFVDTDQLITSRHGSIEEIFRRDGEAGFRAIEHDIAVELGGRQHLVVATGGGMLLDDRNVEAFGDDAVVLCLEASVEEILRRVGGSRTRRPLLAGPDPRSRVVELLEARRPAYARFERVCTDGLDAAEVASVLAARAALAARRSEQPPEAT